MSKVITFCLGVATGLGISQNFNHKAIWENKTNIISRPISLKDTEEIYDDIIKID